MRSIPGTDAPTRARSRATWLPSLTDDGSWTLVHGALGEACHSRSGAWQECRERYAGPCRIAERAREASRRELWLLDVGTGLGLNLAAALEAVCGTGVALHAVTLELDPEVIRAGCALYGRPELSSGSWEAHHGPVRAALRSFVDAPGTATRGAVALGRGSVQLLLGDARATIAAVPERRFDAVFLDPFSPRRAGELWEPAFLARLAACMAPGSWLSTYSAAFRVRLSLARAGLLIGRGPRVGAKGEGTLASPDRAPPELPSRTARRLERRLGPR